MDSFESWARGFRLKAYRRGISVSTFERSFQNMAFNSEVIEKDRNQTESTNLIRDYLDRAVSDSHIENGRKKLGANLDQWEKIEGSFGVEREIIAAIWGLESAYGEIRGEFPVIQSLATLTFDGRRRGLFEDQLIAALRIVQAGDICTSEMRGSWAGAMGHTQLMPTSYLQNALVNDGGGRCNIWSNDPWDALATTAAYLSRFGWRWGQPWGMEVFISEEAGFDFGLCGTDIVKEVIEWAKHGVSSFNHSSLPDHGPASILLPAGANGPVFMVFRNFQILLQYNRALPYGLAVGLLAERISGGRPVQKNWPREDRHLSREERRELQNRLCQAGFDTKGADGIFGPNTFAALRMWQLATGLTPDGYPKAEFLEKLRW